MATNFLQATGGSTAGYFSSVTTIISSETVSLASSVAVTSASIFTSSGSFGQAIWADVFVTWGGSGTGFAPAAGGFVSGWFLRSPDGGTTFELGSSIGQPRAPDFTIALSTTAYANGNIVYGSGLVKMPWSPCKIQLQNNAGTAFPSSATSNTTIKIGPVAVQY